jgi:glycosyltransferase involved in cell wall biosynthesis
MGLYMEMNIEIVNKEGSTPGVLMGATAAGSSPLSASGSQSDNRTHVLFIIDQLCGIGGAERTLLNMVRFLPKNLYRCTVVTFQADPSWSEFENFPCSWWVFPLRRTFDWNALQVALRLRRLIRTQQVRIVHTFFESSDLFGGLVAKLSGVPLLISSRRDMGILRNWKHQVAYRLLSPLFDLVLTVSDEVRAFCIRHDHLEPEKVLTLYNSIEIEKIAATTDAAALRASLDLDGASHLISTVGHVRRVKGVDILIRAAKQVCEEFPRAMFLVIGGVLEPQHLQELRKLIESLGLTENVKFIGPSQDVLSLLKMSNVYCVASRSEGFSNALLEAMACGVPCVATRVGGNPEAVEDGRSGFLVESEDSDALADRIRTLLRHPEHAQKMGREGRRIVEEKFTMPTMMSRLVSLYGIAK